MQLFVGDHRPEDMDLHDFARCCCSGLQGFAWVLQDVRMPFFAGSRTMHGHTFGCRNHVAVSRQRKVKGATAGMGLSVSGLESLPVSERKTGKPACICTRYCYRGTGMYNRYAFGRPGRLGYWYILSMRCHTPYLRWKGPAHRRSGRQVSVGFANGTNTCRV